MIQDGVIEIPNVPVAFTKDLCCSCSRRGTQEHDQNFADKDAYTLAPGHIAVRMSVSCYIRLIDEHRCQSTHDRVDGLNHRPDEIRTRKLCLLSCIGEASDLASVGADHPPKYTEECYCGIDSFHHEEMSKYRWMNEHDRHLYLSKSACSLEPELKLRVWKTLTIQNKKKLSKSLLVIPALSGR